MGQKKELQELKDGDKGLGMGKAKEKKERRKDRVTEELESVTVFWKHYKKINDSLTFQPVPPQSDLQSRIPAGRLAVATKPFMPPTPAFGPRSVEYVRRQAEELELATGDTHEQHSTTLSATGPSSGGTYAGAGSYF